MKKEVISLNITAMVHLYEVEMLEKDKFVFQNLENGGKEISVQDLSQRLFEEMDELVEAVSKEIFQDEENLWKKSLQIQTKKIEDLDLTPSAKLLERLNKDNLTHEELGMQIALDNSKFFESYENSRENIFKKEASLSRVKQKQMESAKGLTFEE